MNLNLSAMMQTVTTMLTIVGLKILGAIAIWIIGRWLISLSLRLIGSALTRQKIDPTLIRYIHSAVAAVLNIVLVIAILGGALLPPTQGWVADLYGIQFSFIVPILAFAYIAFYGLYGYRAGRRLADLNPDISSTP